MNTFFSRDILPTQINVDHFLAVRERGVKIHYVRKGQGTPVLLLHGWPGFWYDWRHVIEPLAQFADVIAPDFRGFGDSDKPDVPPIDGYTPEHLVNDLINLLDELHLKNVVVVAHDIGATVAQLMAKKFPDYVKK